MIAKGVCESSASWLAQEMHGGRKACEVVCAGEARAARLCGMLLTVAATTKRLQVAQGISVEAALVARVKDAEQQMQQALTRSAV